MEGLYRMERLVRVAPEFPPDPPPSLPHNINVASLDGRGTPTVVASGTPSFAPSSTTAAAVAAASQEPTRLQRAKHAFDISLQRRRSRLKSSSASGLSSTVGHSTSSAASTGKHTPASPGRRSSTHLGGGGLGGALGLAFAGLGLGPGMQEQYGIELCASRTTAERTVVVAYTSNEYLLLVVRDNGRAPAVRVVLWFSTKDERIKSLCVSPRGHFCIAVTQAGQVFAIPVLPVLAASGTGRSRYPSTSSPQLAARSAGGVSRPVSRQSTNNNTTFLLSQQQPPQQMQQQQQQRQQDEDGRKRSATSSAVSAFASVRTFVRERTGSTVPTTPTTATASASSSAVPLQLNNLDLPASTLDLTLLGTYRQLKHQATRCEWWTPHTGRPTIIVGTKAGQLHFVDLLQQKVMHSLTVRGRTPIQHLAVQVQAPWTHTVVAQAGNHVYACTIQREPTAEERQSQGGGAHAAPAVSLLDMDLRQPPVAFAAATSSPPAAVQTQRSFPLVCLHSATAAHVFAGDGQSKALNTYRLPENTVALAATDNITFALTRHKGERPRLVICSNLLCTAASQDSRSSDFVVQAFELSPHEDVLSLLPLQHNTVDAGCLLITTQGVYECVQRVAPAHHCLQLLRARRDPDVLAATMRVDLSEVYRLRAVELFSQGAYKESFYHFVRTSTDELDLIAKFARAGQMSLVAQSLRQQLANQSSLSGPLRKRLAGLMLLTYIHLRLTLPDEPEPIATLPPAPGTPRRAPTPPASLQKMLSQSLGSSTGSAMELTRTTRSSSLTFPDHHEDQVVGVGSLDRVLTARDIDESLQAFISDNWDYDFRTALSSFLQHGMLLEFFQAAHARSKVNIALAMPVNRDVLKLSSEAIDFLLARDYSDLICRYSKGILLRCMSPDQLITVLLSRSTHVHTVADAVDHILPVLSEEQCLKLLQFLNPTRPAVRYILERGRRLAAPQFGAPTPRSSTDALSTGAHTTPSSTNSSMIGGGVGVVFASSDGAYDRDTSSPDLMEGAFGTLTGTTDRRHRDRKIVHAYLKLLFAYNRMRLNKADGRESLERCVPWMARVQTWFDLLSGKPDALLNIDPALVNITHTDESELLVSTRHPDDGKFDCGIQHSAAVVGDDLYTWGKALGGRLGQGAIVEEAGQGSVMRVEVLHMFRAKVFGVACGAEHTVVRTSQGVFSWGNNDMGQLGLGHTSSRVQPELVMDLKSTRIDYVVCGHFHTLAMAGSSVWGWGANTYGQLAMSGVSTVTSPRLIRDMSRRRIVSLSAGATHTVALAADGAAYSCGCGLYGQLMLADLPKRQTDLRRIPIDDPVRLVACGPYQTAVVTVGGALVFSGRSIFDRRPIPTDHRAIKEQRSAKPHPAHLKPIRLPLPIDFGSLAKVRISLHHVLLLSDDGRVAAMGLGDCGVLGRGAYDDETTPHVIDTLPQIVHIGAGHGIHNTSSHSADYNYNDDDDGDDDIVDALGSRTPVNSLTRGLGLTVPDFSSVSPVFSGWCVPTTLVHLIGLYSPTEVLRACDDYSDAFAAAALLTLLGDYEEALWRLLTAAKQDYFDRLAGRFDTSARALEAFVCSAVRGFVHMQKERTGLEEEVADGLKRILAVAGYFFEDAGLPIDVFTDLLTEACSDHPSVLVSLVVDAHRLHAQSSAPSPNGSTDDDGNSEHHDDDDVRVRFGPSPVFLRLNQHVCLDTAKDMFQQERPQLACPVCVFVHVRQAVLAQDPAANIPNWTKWT
ncbi:hypothetical protein PTSG_02757 [Salpingoeca rosetta]|uniref:RCC1-like domain-containing protein n=1 Tax=Salpingoeca rosetta (strain ATCC 50818 / BSB-021) TaxID=946362 RepID=F2U382_SALR5|nr:uncharacterized protein PTSG_02757 [Salpingoeca rosetta]EGD82076.1 hypothetical protein PTSG_02757 [Salpingoeca rosetta]|eukprot:XP_004996259.1 hypothetical protein PTSG_02757 [Salpingoeca rosetta]